MTPEEIFMDEFECPSDCEYNVCPRSDIKGTKNSYICICICMKAFIAGYNIRNTITDKYCNKKN